MCVLLAVGLKRRRRRNFFRLLEVGPTIVRITSSWAIKAPRAKFFSVSGSRSCNWAYSQQLGYRGAAGEIFPVFSKWALPLCVFSAARLKRCRRRNFFRLLQVDPAIVRIISSWAKEAPQANFFSVFASRSCNCSYYQQSG